MAQAQQDAEVEVHVREVPDSRLTPEAWDRLIAYLDGLESTQVTPLIPMLLGMMVGVAVALGLLFASL